MSKYTLITGASSGIGYEAAIKFAKEGKNLIVVARREDKLNELKEAVKAINSNLDVVVKIADLSKIDEVHKLYKDVSNYEIETLVNNAGFGDMMKPVDQLEISKIESMIDLNIRALTTLSLLYVKDYKDVEGSTIINVSSALGYLVFNGAVPYSASKFYVSSFTEGLDQDLQKSGAKLRAKVLAPAATITEFADVALDTTGFDYDNFGQTHTAEQMAGFMYELYKSDKTVGKVNYNTYEFELLDPIFPYFSM